MKAVFLNLEAMPRTSTNFYPELLNGLAMYALDSLSNAEIDGPIRLSRGAGL
jgi:hypothetical protein